MRMDENDSAPGGIGRHWSQQPAPREAPARIRKNAGRDMFEARKRAAAAVEAADSANLQSNLERSNSADQLAKNYAILSTMVESEGPGQWKINGLYEQQAIKLGLQHLDKTFAGPLTEFLRRPDGNPLILREQVFRSLLTGGVHLKSMPANDVGAVQRDLQNLTLRQLLRLRVLHLDFNPGGGSSAISLQTNTHAAFLDTMDSLLFRKLGQKAAGQVFQGAKLDATLGRELVLLAAASASIAKRDAAEQPRKFQASVDSPWWWAWRFQGTRIFFNAERFIATCDFQVTEGIVLVVKDCSKWDAANRKWLEWKISLVSDEAELDNMVASAAEALPAGSSTAQKVQPELTADMLASALKGLKKTGADSNESAGASEATLP